VLVEIAARLNRTVRETDMALRWGGEELLFYAPGADERRASFRCPLPACRQRNAGGRKPSC
jgi:PleD family two-component response regulator